MRLFILMILFVAFTSSCKNSEEKKEVSIPKKPNYEKLAQLDWVLGDWNNITEETQSFEKWVKRNDSLYIATSVTLKDGDTIFAENMRLFQKGKVVMLYVETISENPNPITFTQQEGASNVFTFVNPENEFPSEIVYSQPEPNKIHAWVSGIIAGNPQKTDFYFSKTPN